MSGPDEKAAQIIAQLWEFLEPVIQSEGLELVDMEYRRESQGWVLRLFIDQEGGVTVDDCADISQVVGDLLDVEDIIRSAYHLEVSSPGLDRPLRKPEHFNRQVGKVIEVRTAAALEKRRNFKGILVHARPESITIDCEGQVYELRISDIEKARLRYFESLEKQQSSGRLEQPAPNLKALRGDQKHDQ